MPSLSITHKCIACDACRDICPTQAIFIGETIYTIAQKQCIACAGYSQNPLCMEVCPVDAIIYDSSDTTHSAKKD